MPLKRNMPTVFDASKKKLRTITLEEALERVEYICDIIIPEDLRSGIFLINKYRNDLSHHSIILTKNEEEQLISILKGLYDIILDFFNEHIPMFMETVDAQRFELLKEEWEETRRHIQEFYDERALSNISIDEFD